MDAVGLNNLENLLSWYALFTRPRQEDRAASNLKVRGIPVLAPKLKPRRGSKHCHPLFPNYIFACFNAKSTLHKIRFTRGVSYVVGFGGKPAEIADEIIDEICSRMDSKGIVTGMKVMQPGAPVVIQAGPWRDFQGVFEQEFSGPERVRILLTTVAYTLRIEVSKSVIKCTPPGATTGWDAFKAC